MSFSQRCKCCSRPSEITFQVSNECWAKVVPVHFQPHVLCLNCFDSFASNKGISYTEDLGKEMYYCGQISIISLEVKKISTASLTVEDVISELKKNI